MTESKNSGDSSRSTQGNSSGNSSDVTDAERDEAQAAQAEFSKGNYSAALLHLSKLESMRPNDTKVLMNKAVTEYYKSELKKTDAFRKNLSDICSQAGIKIDQVDSSGAADYSVIHLNHAIILYHLQQYRAAITVLEKLYAMLESLEESVGIGVCLLQAECFLGCYQPAHTLSVVSHTEATFLPQPLPPHNPTAKQLHHDKDSKSPEKVISVGVGSGTVGSSSLTSASSSLSSAGGGSSSNNSNNGIGGSEVRGSTGQEQLRGKLQLLRVRAMLMMRTLRLAKKELKAVVTQAVNSGNQLNVTLIFLKSQLEFLRGNHKKAVKVLNQCAAIPPPSLTCGPNTSVAYYNDLGAIHLGLMKPTLACLYLQKALKELQQDDGNSASQKDPLSTLPLYGIGCRVGVEICHNLGITLLHINKPGRAFDFLLEVLQVYPNNPRLWMRIAECCIAVHKEGFEEDISVNNLRGSILQRPVGAGSHRKICLAPQLISHDKKLTDQHATSDAAFPEPTLEFARLCLRNSLALLPENVSATPFTDEQEASGVIPELYQAAPSSPMKGSEVINVRVSTLACSAYVSLCLADYPAALKFAQALLAVHPKISPSYKLMAHMYAGEALICLGRVSEALTYLDPRTVEDVSLSPIPDDPGGQSSSYAVSNQDLFPGNTSTATQLMRYNLSVAYALRGELEKANSLLIEVWNKRDGNMPAQVIMLAMYIQLQLGNVEIMKAIIKKYILFS